MRTARLTGTGSLPWELPHAHAAQFRFGPAGRGVAISPPPARGTQPRSRAASRPSASVRPARKSMLKTPPEQPRHMILEAAVTEPLPIAGTAAAVLLASLALVVVWVAYLYR
ncbi:hypothetical protein BN903_27 [Halorubrum sp. AJ67]|nr:hypothetical protein BN903_27 [Halorubrum sp. AJ67]